jgi:hypothetical protein
MISDKKIFMGISHMVSRLPTKMSVKLKIEKWEMKLKKIFSETTEPISTKLG